MTVTWPREALPPNTVVNGYRIESLLGTGGFGITYRAVDGIDQVFALKECYPRQFCLRDGANVEARSDADGEMLATCLDGFTREARALTLFSRDRLPVDGVVRVITYFEANRTAYIVMELLEGEALDRVIEAHPDGVPAPVLDRIVRILLPALAAVHDGGLLHRDIKPANIFIRRDGRPVLLDFGAARANQAGGAAHTQIYSENYAPIEQIEGATQGPYSDIYALGVTCYQAVAGARFKPATCRASRRHLAEVKRESDPLSPAAEVGAGRYDPALLAMIDSALRVSPADRPQTVGAMIQALDRASRAPTPDDGATLVVPRPAPPQAARAPSGRGVLLASAGVLLLAGAGAAAYLAIGRRHAAPSVAPVATHVAAPPPMLMPPPEAAPAASPAAAAAYRNGDYAAALAAYRQAAESGDATAQYQLGYMFQIGQGTAADPLAAKFWYEKAAAQHVAAAQNQLGYLYQTGLGVQQDYAAAATWYGQAASQGFVTAQYQLGYLAQHGLGEVRNYADARRWYGLAAAQGSAAAQQQMGFMAQMGLGTHTDYGEAMRWYKQAAAQRSAAGLFSVGHLYAQGLGVPKDMAAAHDWMVRAADAGSAEAKAWLVAH